MKLTAIQEEDLKFVEWFRTKNPNNYWLWIQEFNESKQEDSK